jgi:hypothetical protein
MTHVSSSSYDTCILLQVLDKLRLVEGIEHALLIVSFDGLSPEMLEVAKTINFCRQQFSKVTIHRGFTI